MEDLKKEFSDLWGEVSPATAYQKIWSFIERLLQEQSEAHKKELKDAINEAWESALGNTKTEYIDELYKKYLKI